MRGEWERSRDFPPLSLFRAYGTQAEYNITVWHLVVTNLFVSVVLCGFTYSMRRDLWFLPFVGTALLSLFSMWRLRNGGTSRVDLTLGCTISALVFAGLPLLGAIRFSGLPVAIANAAFWLFFLFHMHGTVIA